LRVGGAGATNVSKFKTGKWRDVETPGKPPRPIDIARQDGVNPNGLLNVPFEFFADRAQNLVILGAHETPNVDSYLIGKCH